MAEAAGRGRADGDLLRRAGRLYDRLNARELAAAAYAGAVRADRARLAQATDPEQRARLLFSLAQTFGEQGRNGEAASTAARAEELAVSAAMRNQIARWRGAFRG